MLLGVQRWTLPLRWKLQRTAATPTPRYKARTALQSTHRTPPAVAKRPTQGARGRGEQERPTGERRSTARPHAAQLTPPRLLGPGSTLRCPAIQHDPYGGRQGRHVLAGPLARPPAPDQAQSLGPEPAAVRMQAQGCC